MKKPYKRTEAEEMMKLFNNIDSQKSENLIKIKEDRSLSTIENLINSKKILEKLRLGNARVNIFCDKLRSYRVETLASEIFNNFEIISYKFAGNKYKKVKRLIKEKERLGIKYYLWAMKDKDNWKIYRKNLKERLRILRNTPPNKWNEVEVEIWKKAIKEFKENPYWKKELN